MSPICRTRGTKKKNFKAQLYTAHVHVQYIYYGNIMNNITTQNKHKLI